MRNVLGGILAAILFLIASGMEAVEKGAVLKAREEFSAYGLRVVNLGGRAAVAYGGRAIGEYPYQEKAASDIEPFPGVSARLSCVGDKCFRIEASFRSAQIFFARLIRAWQGKEPFSFRAGA